MNSIGYIDVETYVRELVSEGFGKQSEESVQSEFGQSSDPDPKAPFAVPDQSNNKKKDRRNDAGS